MSDNPNVDTQNPTGAGGETNPPVSNGGGQSVAGSADLSKLVRDAIAEELKPIKGEISGIYSRQDKDRNAVRELMDEIKKQQAKGLSENDAIEAAQSALSERAETKAEKQMLKEIHAKLFGESSANPTGTRSNGTGETDRVIQELSLDANSPDVINILAKRQDPAMQELELRRLAQRPKPTPSPSASLAGNAPVSEGVDAERLYAEMATLYKEPTKNAARLAAIQKQLGR
jgi:hypothetical protein